MRRQYKALLLLQCLALILPCTILLSVSVGAVTIDPLVTLRVLLEGLGFNIAPPDTRDQLIIWSLRLPRALLAALVGACLALCGAAIQGLFRNPLADPALIGVSSGASVGASTAIVMGATLFAGHPEWAGSMTDIIAAYAIIISAFVGGLVTTLVVYRLGTSQTGTSVATMLLAGIAINALAAAISNIFSYIADDSMLRRLSLWRMGSLSGGDWMDVGVSGALIMVVTLAILRDAPALNALLLGESEARHLGVQVERVKRRLIILTALGVGAAVSVSGMIGFVGLVVPHLVRLLIGPDHRYLLPASVLLGAILMVLADVLARVAVAPEEVPIGIVTALLGAPFFIALLLKQRRRLI